MTVKNAEAFILSGDESILKGGEGEIFLSGLERQTKSYKILLPPKIDSALGHNRREGIINASTLITRDYWNSRRNSLHDTIF